VLVFWALSRIPASSSTSSSRSSPQPWFTSFEYDLCPAGRMEIPVAIFRVRYSSGRVACWMVWVGLCWRGRCFMGWWGPERSSKCSIFQERHYHGVRMVMHQCCVCFRNLFRLLSASLAMVSCLASIQTQWNRFNGMTWHGIEISSRSASKLCMDDKIIEIDRDYLEPPNNDIK